MAIHAFRRMYLMGRRYVIGEVISDALFAQLITVIMYKVSLGHSPDLCHLVTELTNCVDSFCVDTHGLIGLNEPTFSFRTMHLHGL